MTYSDTSRLGGKTPADYVVDTHENQNYAARAGAAVSVAQRAKGDYDKDPSPRNAELLEDANRVARRELENARREFRREVDNIR
jgi:hypothetical protein